MVAKSQRNAPSTRSRGNAVRIKTDHHHSHPRQPDEIGKSGQKRAGTGLLHRLDLFVGVAVQTYQSLAKGPYHPPPMGTP